MSGETHNPDAPAVAPPPDPEQFPALKKLASKYRSRRIPYVAQMQALDCGAACLAMVLGYHGKHVKLEEVREIAGVDRDGVDALAILRAAEWYGMRGRGIKLDIEDLDFLEPGSILHWEFNHFVVYERETRTGVDIVDPAFGRRHVPEAQFRRSFTGVALLLEPSEAFEPAPPAKNRVWAYLRQVLRQALLTRILVTSILIQLFALAVPLLTGVVVDRVVPRADRHLLLVTAVGLASLIGFHFLSSIIRSHLLLQLRTHMDTRMTLGFLDHLVDLPYAFFQRRSTGDLMMRVNSNATIREILTSNTISGLLDGALVSIYLVLLFLMSSTMGLLVLVIGLLQVLVFWLSRRKYQDLMAQNLEVQSRSQGYLVQLLSGIETLKVAGAEHRAVEHWSNLFVDELNVSLERGRIAAVVDSLMGALRMGAPMLILGYGAVLVLDGQLTLGTMLALNALAGGFLGPLSTLVSSALQLQLLKGYVERIDDILTTEPEQQRDKVQRAGNFRGGIQLERVSFRYGPMAPMVVQDVSVAIRTGQSVAIVGKSGSGKSTLANLLMGLYQPTSGRILYDGQDLAELDARSVRRQLGYVPQRPYFFGSTLRANIALSDPTLPLDRVVHAAKLACIHEDIMQMGMGYETVMVDAGASLSGGQRQRVALARALVHRPAILLLDEATSALDTVTEAAVQRNLTGLRCTRIIIAHRLSTIMNADVILVMAEGRIVEAGTHNELLAQRGAYFELVAAQSDRDRTARAS